VGGICIHVVGVQGVDDVFPRHDKHDVARTLAGNVQSASVKWLRDDLSVDMAFVQPPERGRADVAGLQNRFVKLGAGAGVVIVLGQDVVCRRVSGGCGERNKGPP
jgi:hypothetical protein